MRGPYDEEEFESLNRRRDTELTLSSFSLLGIFFGLVLLCGLFFGIGYEVGRHSASQPAAAIHLPAAISRPFSSLGNSSSKPLASAPTGSISSSQQAAATPITNPAAGYSSGQSGNSVAPASTSATVLMVQIAAVPDEEDAEVLVNALRKHGYAVTAHREPVDNLIHVRIGPFSNRNDANATRLKLLNDGYNAIMQP
jgi:cell division septation protein DedD